MDGSTLLASLAATPAMEMNAAAAKAVKNYPNETRALTIDLIFYRWAATSLEVDPDIDRIDEISGALMAYSKDRAVIWAASELGPKGWGARPLPSDEDDETVKSLKEAKFQLGSALSYASRSPSRSIESLNSCGNALRNVRLELSAAFIDGRLAERHLYATRRYRDAESFYNRARPILAAYGLQTHVARIYQDLGKLNEDAGRYDAARENYVESAKTWLAADRGDLAGAQYVSAGLALARLGKDRAFSEMNVGLDYSRNFANTRKGSYEAHAQLVMQVASFCIDRGQYDDARKLLDEPNLRTKLGDSLTRAQVLRMLASAVKSLGQEEQSRNYLIERTRILSALAQKGQDALMELNSQALTTAEQLSRLTMAETGASANATLERYQPAIEMLTQVVAGYSTLKRSDDSIRLLRNLAAAQDALGDRKSGLVSRLQAAQLAKESGKFAVSVEILRDIQKSAKESGDTETQTEALFEAKKVAEISGDLRAEADILYARGVLLQSLGRPTDAADDLRTAAGLYSDQIGDLWSAAAAVSKLSEILDSTGQKGEAIKVLSDVLARIEKWANDEGIDPGMEPSQADTLVGLYARVVTLEVSQNRLADAGAHLKTAKQYAWFDGVATRLRSSGNSTVISLLNNLPQDNHSNTAEKGLPHRIAVGWTAVLTKAAAFSPLASSRGSNRAVVDAVEIYRDRNKLPDNLAIVAYALDDKAPDIYILVATKKTATCWQLPGASDHAVASAQAFRKAIQEIERDVSTGMQLPPVKSWSDAKVALMLLPLFSIEEMLVAPIRDDLKQNQITAIAFALPDKLAGIPFNALPQEVRGSPGQRRFLLQDYSVSYITREMLHDLTSPTAGPILPKKVTVSIFPNSVLPASAGEAKAIRSFFPNSKTWIDASADRFVHECASAGVVHIVTHHEPETDPTNISIVLYGSKGGAGTVRITDLMKINNPGLRLAVMSACDSVGSTDADANGTTHVAEAFGLAGFPSFVGGLWKVSDRASSSLMSEFYRILAKDGRKAESLRRAQQSMIKSPNGEFAHPFYWASFALYGDPR